jgi:hypothetical protein
MGLPIQKAPQYKCELPMSGIEVSYRPFLVKEQNHLLIARESEDATAIFDAIMNLIKAVTDGKVDGAKLPLVDLEYLFLQIRTKSIGETAKVPLMCMKDECDGVGYTELDLTKIKVDVSGIQDSKVQLNEHLIVELEPPSSELVYAIEGLGEVEMIKPILRGCMLRIYDDENIYEMAEHRDSEIDEFIESLTVQQFEKISDYFGSMPSLQEEVEYKCDKCGEVSNNTLSGLQSFF